jgi:SAM-dependent methyltransferase
MAQPVNYGDFCGMVTGYRQLTVVMTAVDLGIIDAVAETPCDLESLLEITGMRPVEGERFVRALVGAGILDQRDSLLHLSPFSATYLHSGSGRSQRGVLEFERLLQERWQGLGKLLLEGQGSDLEEKPAGEYRWRLGMYQRAMGEAAVVRCDELWDAVGPLTAEGVMVDIGAGSGSYLTSFLARNPGWRGLACDLADPLELVPAGEAIGRWPCNLHDQRERCAFVDHHREHADLVLLSNFIHCYSREDLLPMLGELAGLLAPRGVVVIHDFFTDGNSFGHLYDLHMLVNTYNGRTYTFAETAQLLAEAGLTVSRTVELPSLSHAVIARRAG